MKIVKIDIPKGGTGNFRLDNGLSDIKMNKLKELVILAGKNGSGKTRILNLVRERLQSKPAQTFLKDMENRIRVLEQNIDSYRNQIISIDKQLQSNQNDANLQQQRDYYSSRITDDENNIKSSKEQIEANNFITTDVSSEQYYAIDFVPKNLNLADSYNESPAGIKQKSEQAINGLGSDSLQDITLSYIQQTQNRWYESTHQNTTIPEAERNIHIKQYKDLNSLIELFFKKKLNRNAEGQVTIFDFRIGDAKLSDGQKIILQLCVAIHAQGAKLSDVIIMMDEPENHLHPSIIIETIDKIRSVITNGQIWIATHSIPLLAHFGAEYIHFVEDGQVRYGGNIPEKVLESLLGDDDEKQRLLEFISLPEQMAMNRFAYECLFPPRVVSTGKDDPQTKQANTLIQSIIDKNDSVRILDYGAGKGRLLSSVVDNDYDLSKIDYVAFDFFDNDKIECLSAISKAYPANSEKRYYNTERDLNNDHNKNSFDIVVLSNVLHEIEPKDWGNLFNEKGNITSQLKADGYLLLIEDTLLPIGEKANSKGFMVLDTAQLRDLFCCSNEDMVIVSDKGDRLKAHLIPASKLINISLENKRECFKSLIDTAKGEIKRIRGLQSPNMRDGRTHAFWTQQLANAIFALDELQ